MAPEGRMEDRGRGKGHKRGREEKSGVMCVKEKIKTKVALNAGVGCLFEPTTALAHGSQF